MIDSEVKTIHWCACFSLPDHRLLTFVCAKYRDVPDPCEIIIMDQDGRKGWTAHRFVRIVYELFVPQQMKLIATASRGWPPAPSSSSSPSLRIRHTPLRSWSGCDSLLGIVCRFLGSKSSSSSRRAENQLGRHGKEDEEQEQDEDEEDEAEYEDCRSSSQIHTGGRCDTVDQS